MAFEFFTDDSASVDDRTGLSPAHATLSLDRLFAPMLRRYFLDTIN
jgi:hypothetical protein